MKESSRYDGERGAPDHKDREDKGDKKPDE